MFSVYVWPCVGHSHAFEKGHTVVFHVAASCNHSMSRACQEEVNALTARMNETFRQSSSSTVASRVDRLENRRYSGHLLYWYKSTNTDAEGSAASRHITNTLREHGFAIHEQAA